MRDEYGNIIGPDYPLHHAYVEACEDLDAHDRIAKVIANHIGTDAAMALYKKFVKAKYEAKAKYLASDEPRIAGGDDE